MNSRLCILICFLSVAFIFPLRAQTVKLHNSQNYTANWHHISRPSYNLLHTTAFPKIKIQPLIQYIDSLIASTHQTIPFRTSTHPSFIIYDNPRGILESNIIANDYNTVNNYPVVVDDAIILHSNSNHYQFLQDIRFSYIKYLINAKLPKHNANDTISNSFIEYFGYGWNIEEDIQLQYRIDTLPAQLTFEIITADQQLFKYWLHFLDYKYPAQQYSLYLLFAYINDPVMYFKDFCKNFKLDSASLLTWFKTYCTTKKTAYATTYPTLFIPIAKDSLSVVNKSKNSKNPYFPTYYQLQPKSDGFQSQVINRFLKKGNILYTYNNKKKSVGKKIMLHEAVMLDAYIQDTFSVIVKDSIKSTVAPVNTILAKKDSMHIYHIIHHNDTSYFLYNYTNDTCFASQYHLRNKTTQAISIIYDSLNLYSHIKNMPKLLVYVNTHSILAKEKTIIQSAQKMPIKKQVREQSLQLPTHLKSKYISNLIKYNSNIDISNQQLLNSYQPYQSHLGNYNIEEINIISQTKFTDIFKNYVFNFNYRIPNKINGSELILAFNNYKPKTDWHINYQRKVRLLNKTNPAIWEDDNGMQLPAFAKLKTTLVNLGFSKPIHYYAAFNSQITFRADKTYFPALDAYSLQYKPLQNNYVIIKHSFAYNNYSYDANKNILGGQLLHLTFNFFNHIDKQYKNAWELHAAYATVKKLQQYGTLLYKLDISKSFGMQKVLFNIGGVQNNVTPVYDTTQAFGKTDNYIMQRNVYNFRGASLNQIYGSAYLLSNIDYVSPSLKEVINKNLYLNLLHNIKIGCYADLVMLPDDNKKSIKIWHSLGFSAQTSIASKKIIFTYSFKNKQLNNNLWYLSLIL